jgi:hypothetical protein
MIVCEFSVTGEGITGTNDDEKQNESVRGAFFPMNSW